MRRGGAPHWNGFLGRRELLGMLAGATSLILRFRGSRGEQRQQIKWLAIAVAAVPIMFVASKLYHRPTR